MNDAIQSAWVVCALTVTRSSTDHDPDHAATNSQSDSSVDSSALLTRPVASIGLMSTGATTDGVTSPIFFLKKTELTLLVTVCRRADGSRSRTAITLTSVRSGTLMTKSLVSVHQCRVQPASPASPSYCTTWMPAQWLQASQRQRRHNRCRRLIRVPKDHVDILAPYLIERWLSCRKAGLRAQIYP